jgi:chorismate mutase
MITKGIRGAITVDTNNAEDIKTATIELFTQLIKENNINKDFVSHVIFTMTKELDAAYPAKFVRQDLGWDKTAFMCEQELDVENSLKKCIRVLIVYNCENNFEPKFVYLKGAKDLRK